MDIAPALALVIVATLAILNLGRLAGSVSFSVSRLEYIYTQLTYQAMLLGVASLVLLAAIL